MTTRLGGHLLLLELTWRWSLTQAGQLFEESCVSDNPDLNVAIVCCGVMPTGSSARPPPSASASMPASGHPRLMACSWAI